LESYKLLFIEWLLEINIAIGKKLVNMIARMEADQYAEDNKELDMRTVSPAVKRGIIHDEAVLNERWNLCLGCEFLTDSNKCEKCGCFMKVKHKMAYAKCPIGKWDRYTQKKINVITATN
tara:strand:+ start:118 stop:477 length:360 start_codon:yes stop_codon:yes gene_type:complete